MRTESGGAWARLRMWNRRRAGILIAVLLALYYICLFAWRYAPLPKLPPARDEPAVTLQRQLTVNPRDTQALVQLALYYRANGEVALARRLLSNALILESTDDHARCILAEMDQADGRLWRAFRGFHAVYERRPENVAAGVRAADICRERGDKSRAISIYKDVVSRRPDTVLAHYWLGVLHAEEGTCRAAVRDFEAVINIAPSITDAPERLAALRRSPPDVEMRLMREHWWKILLPLLLSLSICGASRLLGRMKIPALSSPSMINVHVYLISLSALLFAHYMKISTDPALNGEELASAYRNVFYLEQRLQHDPMATNFSGSLFFWAGSHLFPLSVQSQRLFKIMVIALLPCIVVALLTRLVPNAKRISMAYVAGVVMLISSLSWYSIMATEYVLDCVFSFVMLLMAFGLPVGSWRARDWGRTYLVGGMAIVVVHAYGSSLPLLPVTACAVAYKGLRMGKVGIRARLSRLLGLLFLGALVAVGATWPFLYISSGSVHMFAGGGKLETAWPSICGNLSVVLGDMFVRPESYLIAGDVDVSAFPVVGPGGIVLLLAVCGGIHAVRLRRVEDWSIMAVLVLSIALAGLVSNCPGIRRAVPAVVCIVVLSGMGVEMLWRTAGRMEPMLSSPMAATRAHLRPVLMRLAAVCTVALLVGSFGVSWYRTYTRVHLNYKAWLQREFLLKPEKNYEETVEALVNEVSKGRIVLSGRDYNRETVILLHLICARRGLPYVPPRFDAEWDVRLAPLGLIER